jgi:hypothetical protein
VPLFTESFGRIDATTLTLLRPLVDQAVQAGCPGLSRDAIMSGALWELGVALCRGDAPLRRSSLHALTEAVGSTPLRGLAFHSQAVANTVWALATPDMPPAGSLHDALWAAAECVASTQHEFAGRDQDGVGVDEARHAGCRTGSLCDVLWLAVERISPSMNSQAVANSRFASSVFNLHGVRLQPSVASNPSVTDLRRVLLPLIRVALVVQVALGRMDHCHSITPCVTHRRFSATSFAWPYLRQLVLPDM